MRGKVAHTVANPLLDAVILGRVALVARVGLQRPPEQETSCGTEGTESGHVAAQPTPRQPPRASSDPMLTKLFTVSTMSQ
jgi:hypothetical protein